MNSIVGQCLESLASYAITEVEKPTIRLGQALVRIAACGVGYVDSLVALGRYQVKPRVPHISGQEFAGIVEQVADDVSNVRVGDHVLGMSPGRFAEYDVVRAPPRFIRSLRACFLNKRQPSRSTSSQLIMD